MLASFIAKHTRSSSKQHEISELHPSTLRCLIWSQILTAGSAFLPLTALLCITCPIVHNSWSYLCLPGQRRVSALLGQAHLLATTALAHNPADTFHSSSRGDTFTEPTIPREARVLPQLSVHHLLWQLTLHADRFDRWKVSFQSQDTSQQVLLSAQTKWFSLLSSQWNRKRIPQTSSSLVVGNGWAISGERSSERLKPGSSEETTPLFPITI